MPQAWRGRVAPLSDAARFLRPPEGPRTGGLTSPWLARRQHSPFYWSGIFGFKERRGRVPDFYLGSVAFTFMFCLEPPCLQTQTRGTCSAASGPAGSCAGELPWWEMRAKARPVCVGSGACAPPALCRDGQPGGAGPWGCLLLLGREGASRASPGLPATGPGPPSRARPRVVRSTCCSSRFPLAWLLRGFVKAGLVSPALGAVPGPGASVAGSDCRETQPCSYSIYWRRRVLCPCLPRFLCDQLHCRRAGQSLACINWGRSATWLCPGPLSSV